MADKGYNIVLQYTPEAEGYAGCRYWTSFKSKQEFDKQRNALCKKGKVEVIAEGVTNEKAIQLCENVPFINKLSACAQKATTPDGSIDTNILGMELDTLLVLETLRLSKK